MKSYIQNKGCFGSLGEFSIMAYVDKENFNDELLDVYEKAGITIILEGGEIPLCLNPNPFFNLYICLKKKLMSLIILSYVDIYLQGVNMRELIVC